MSKRFVPITGKVDGKSVTEKLELDGVNPVTTKNVFQSIEPDFGNGGYIVTQEQADEIHSRPLTKKKPDGVYKSLPIHRCWYCPAHRQTSEGEVTGKCLRAGNYIEDLNTIPSWCPLDDC